MRIDGGTAANAPRFDSPGVHPFFPSVDGQLEQSPGVLRGIFGAIVGLQNGATAPGVTPERRRRMVLGLLAAALNRQACRQRLRLPVGEINAVAVDKAPYETLIICFY
jgi:hypothetical protein